MKLPKKHRYNFDIHFRRGNDEKDWIDIEFSEFTFEEAYEKAMNWARFVFKAELSKFDKKKVFKENDRYYYIDAGHKVFVI